MNSKIILLFLMLSGTYLAVAQPAQSTQQTKKVFYSYVSDRRFKDPTDLIGYQFRPNEFEIKDVEKREIRAGSHSFGVTQSNLYVEGEGIAGVYSINNINPTEYGFQLMLMNARDPTIQGHLKVILNDRGQADALVFKRATKDKEMIFYNPIISEPMRDKESKFFTDKNEFIITKVDSLWGKAIRPFLRVQMGTMIQDRFQMADSTILSFEEKTTIIDKTKKKDKNKDATDVANNVATDSTTVAVADASTDDAKKVKIIKEYFVHLRTITNYNDGRVEAKKQTWQIEKWDTKEDKNGTGTDDRFLIELKTKKGEAIDIYLNTKQAVSAFVIGSERYLMRGY